MKIMNLIVVLFIIKFNLASSNAKYGGKQELNEGKIFFILFQWMNLKNTINTVIN